MDFPLLSDKNYSYLYASLQKIQNQQTEEESQNYQDQQKQACSSLCELSNNICLEDTKNQSGIQFYNKKIKQKDIGLSPWKNKSKQKVLITKQEKRLFTKHHIHRFLQKSDFQRCCTQNKENFGHQKVNHQKENKLMKITSAILKKVQSREKKHLNCKPENHQIEFIALMCKRKKYSMQIGENCFLKEKKRGNETQPIIYKTFTPKILNLHHIEQQNQRISDKKLIKNALCGWSEEMKENPKNITLINDHWKAKSNQNKSKKNKKIFVVRDAKSSEARDVKQNLLLCRRGSVSVDKQKKGDYKSNNPLTRLLYQKYLNTIGVSNHSKQLRSKHL